MDPLLCDEDIGLLSLPSRTLSPSFRSTFTVTSDVMCILLIHIKTDALTSESQCSFQCVLCCSVPSKCCNHYHKCVECEINGIISQNEKYRYYILLFHLLFTRVTSFSPLPKTASKYSPTSPQASSSVLHASSLITSQISFSTSLPKAAS